MCPRRPRPVHTLQAELHQAAFRVLNAMLCMLCMQTQDEDVYTRLTADFVAAESAYLAALKKAYVGELPPMGDSAAQVRALCTFAYGWQKQGPTAHCLPARVICPVTQHECPRDHVLTGLHALSA